MEGELYVVAEKVGALDRMLNVNAKVLLRGLADFMIGLAKVGTSTSTSDAVNLLAGASEIVSGVFTVVEGIFSDEKDPVEHRAFIILYNGIRRGMMKLLHQHLDAIKEATGKNYDAKKYQVLIDQVEAKWAETDLEIRYSFFEDCGSFPFWGTIQRLMRDWLMAVGMEPDPAKEIALKLEPLICSAIGDIMRGRLTYFQKVKDAVKDEVGSALAWRRYRYKMKLIHQWEEDIFYEPFGLDKLYIPLNACLPLKEPYDDYTHEVVPSEKYILGWLQNQSAESKILVLRGGPGSGKSSLMRKIAREVALDNERAVYVFRLQLFTVNDDFVNSMQAYLEDVEQGWEGQPKLFSAKQSVKDKSPLFIFDGLDELSQSKRDGQALAGEFISKLTALLRQKAGWGDWDIRAIVTGRDYVVQKLATSTLSSTVPVLELLPYSVGKLDEPTKQTWEGFEQHLFHDKQALLLGNQRRQWWRQFWTAKGNERTDVPKEIQAGEYDQLSRQPLLSYLLAFEYDKGRLAGTQNINLVYENLVDSLRTRKWGGKDGHRHSTFADKDKFFRLMEEIAISAWHDGDVRVTNLKDLQIRCDDQGLQQLMKDFKTDVYDVQTTLNELVVSTFAKLHKEASESVDLIEFTHKSFGEYLVARRICALAKDVAVVLNRNEASSNQKAMDLWMRTCSQGILTSEIWTFLEREAKLKSTFVNGGTNLDAAQIQSGLADLFFQMINSGYKAKEGESSLQIINQTRNTEINLWMTISGFARVSEKPTKINWKDEEQPRRILGWAWVNPELGFLRKGFQRTVFPFRVSFCQADLNQADLRFADLTSADLRYATLTEADLRFAVLNDANLSTARLEVASLGDANLQGADLHFANLIHADLRNANLSFANLWSTNLRYANLTNTNLTNANFEDAKCYPIQVGGILLTGQEAYEYLIFQDAINVPLPPKEIESPH